MLAGGHLLHLKMLELAEKQGLLDLGQAADMLSTED
jgi:hypothetical protein